ncbi:MAG: hypothetical protein QXG40_04855 [Ignisphaera sp.]
MICSLRNVDLKLVSPQTRRIVEEYMNKIVEGKKEYREALDETLKLYSTLYRQLKEKIDRILAKLVDSMKKHHTYKSIR